LEFGVRKIRGSSGRHKEFADEDETFIECLRGIGAWNSRMRRVGYGINENGTGRKMMRKGN